MLTSALLRALVPTLPGVAAAQMPALALDEQLHDARAAVRPVGALGTRSLTTVFVQPARGGRGAPGGMPPATSRGR